MPSTDPTPETPLKHEIIRDVMNDCHCSEMRAVNLLQRSNNDPEMAKTRHRTLMNYINQSSLGPSRPLVPHSSTSGAISVHSSDDDESEDTLSVDECLPITSKSPASTRPDLAEIPFEREAEARHRGLPSTPSEPDLPSFKNSNMASTVSQNLVNKDLEVAFNESLSQAEPDVPDPNPTSDDSSGEEKEVTEWEFILPRIPPPPTLVTGAGEGQESFNLPDLVGAIQHGASLEMIQNYLGYYEKGTVKRYINNTIKGFPTIFYAVATNNELVIRTWITYGGDVTATHKASSVPLLAFAIMHSETIQEDTTLIVATLLSLGALPHVIPAAFYTPYCRDLPENSLNIVTLEDMNNENKKWCTSAASARLARTANLTQRYYLERAAKTKKPSIRQRQIALRRNAEALLGIPYFLIGQTMAANRLQQKLLSHIMVASNRPLVLVFAGPSGHGKTELARALGYLLSLELEVVDCTIFNRESDLFGPRHPYVGADRGSPLNNFLAKNAGERCIVFLDEFEKTTSDIHQALLLPFDNGEYQDRRHLTKIDCSKTIWILATNALDTIIQTFCALNHQTIFLNDTHSEKLMKKLSRELKEGFLTKFDSPITGRISAFLPFLPFSAGEQAVVVHKYLLELGRKVKARTSLRTGPNEQLLGNVRLYIRRDASVCSILAKAEYHCDLGARSLITAVKSIEDMLVEAYLDEDEEIAETDRMDEFVLDVVGGEVVGNMAPRKGDTV